MKQTKNTSHEEGPREIPYSVSFETSSLFDCIKAGNQFYSQVSKAISLNLGEGGETVLQSIEPHFEAIQKVLTDTIGQNVNESLSLGNNSI